MGEPVQKELPYRIFYKIGQTSRIVGVESYVLRYWETEFPFLNPKKTKTGQRLYSKKDIEIISQIKKMLYEEKYTVEGVRKKLSRIYQSYNAENLTEEDKIEKIKRKLKEILNILS